MYVQELCYQTPKSKQNKIKHTPQPNLRVQKYEPKFMSSKINLNCINPIQ